MGLWKKQQRQSRPVADTDARRVPRPATPGDPALPGIAGYHGIEPLEKNAMPASRFKFVRPDGKP